MDFQKSGRYQQRQTNIVLFLLEKLWCGEMKEDNKAGKCSKSCRRKCCNKESAIHLRVLYAGEFYT